MLTPPPLDPARLLPADALARARVRALAEDAIQLAEGDLVAVVVTGADGAILAAPAYICAPEDDIERFFLDVADATDPLYWVRHLRNTVQFADCLATLKKVGHRVYLEVGPGKALGSLAENYVGLPF